MILFKIIHKLTITAISISMSMLISRYWSEKNVSKMTALHANNVSFPYLTIFEKFWVGGDTVSCSSFFHALFSVQLPSFPSWKVLNFFGGSPTVEITLTHIIILFPPCNFSDLLPSLCHEVHVKTCRWHKYIFNINWYCPLFSSIGWCYHDLHIKSLVLSHTWYLSPLSL